MSADTDKKLGDREVVTADDIGWDRAEQIVKNSTSMRAEPVKTLLDNANAPQVVLARQYVRDGRNPGRIIPRMRAMTATGFTRDGDALAATYMADLRAALGTQAETIRFGANAICLDRGEATTVFGWVGPWHLLEANAFRQAAFEEVAPTKVSTSALTAVRDWTRGKDLVWLKLPSLAAAKAAAEMRAKVAMIQEIEDRLLICQVRGEQPDSRLLRRYHELKIGLDAYWFFIGVHSKVAIEREPSVDAIKAAKPSAPLVIEH